MASTAVLLGLIGGLSLMTIAGARRTQSSYPRFLRSVDASTMSVSSATVYDPGLTAKIAALPHVLRSRSYVSFDAIPLVHGEPDPSQKFEAVGTFDGRFFDQDRFTATEGVMADPTKVGQVVVNELAARTYGYQVGQRIDIGVSATDQLDPESSAEPAPPRLEQRVTVVGIGLFPDEVLPDEGDIEPRVLFTPAFTRRVTSAVNYAFQGLVLARGEADEPAIKAAVQRLLPDASFEFRRSRDDEDHAARAVRPLTAALLGFGAVTGLAGLALGAQAIGRLAAAGRQDREVFRALGASPRALGVSGALGPALAVLAGTTVAVVVAVAASPTMPLGPVRRVEPAGGADVDGLVLGLGALVMLGFFGTVCLVASARERSRRMSPARSEAVPPSRLIERVARTGVGPTVLIGIRFAFERNGERAAGSGRSVAIGAAVALTTLVAAVTFGASLDRLVDRPTLFGWNADAVVLAGSGYGNIASAPAKAVLDDDPTIEGWSGASFGEADVNGVAAPLLGMDPGAATAPPITAGRMIGGPGEIVLGALTASRLHAGVGDVVSVITEGGPRQLRVTGIATLPTIGQRHATHTSVGVGGIVTVEDVPGHDLDITGTERGDFGPRAIFVRFRRGTDVETAIRRLRKTTQPLATFAGLEVVPVQRPAEIVDARSIGGAPVLLALVLTLGAALSLVLALLAAVRRRWADLAVLRSIGLTPRQLGSTVVWQSASIVAVGVVGGVPGGVVLGRLLWSAFAHQLGVVVSPRVPLQHVLAVTAGALVLAALVAAMPGRSARRTASPTPTRS